MKRIYLWLLFSLGTITGSAQIAREVSYFNVTSGGRGPIAPWDVIEIRAVISVPNGTTITGLSFTGIVPPGTVYIPGSIAAKTNENVTTVTNTGTYTDAAGDDRGFYTSSSQQIRIYMGDGATSTTGGNVTGGTTIPRHYNIATIIQATYRVRVERFQGSLVTLGGNAFTYNGGSIALPNITIFVSYNNACTSFDPIGNLVAVENGGTFGSGNTLNRPTSSPYTTGFTFVNIATNYPVDGQYAIVKSTSPNSGTGRVYPSWDIIGDHTGTTTAAGNPAPSGPTTGGYMLLVNATYSPSAVFSYSVSGLIPGMDYTIRFWVRNICVGACSSNPNGGGGSGPGVLPNLIFAVNGADRYSTGPVPSGVGWREHTFTFNTGTLTAGNLVIRNNAPGGGGNDWVIDDISLNRCLIILPEAVEKIAVERTENTSIVKWSIANDQALKEYVVQYSEDGKSFEDAGSVLASGRGGNYSYNDVRSISNKLYYRIKSINKNNEERYSKTVMIRAGQQLTKSLKISPNPASQNPAVQFNVARRTAAAITIVDGAGRLVSRSNVQAESGMNSHTISTKLAPGIYTVVVDCGNGDILRERLVIIDK